MTTHPFLEAHLSLVPPGRRPIVRLLLVNRSTTEIAELLRYNLPFEGQLDNDVFVVCNASGGTLEWLGRYVKRPTPTERDYFFIGPGESAEWEVDLSPYYEGAASEVTYAAYHEALSEPRPLYHLRSNTLSLTRP